ncbi:MAG: D-2-hydroxyacid dehydrogenase [Anaerolineae bacterium]
MVNGQQTGNGITVLCTLRFSEAQLDKLRAVSPRLEVVQHTVRRGQAPPAGLVAAAEIVYLLSPWLDPARAPRLKWVQLHSAGINHLLDSPLWRSEVPLTTANGIHAIAIGEYVLAMALALTRKVPKMLHYQRAREWPPGRWDKFVSTELHGATMGIVGYGGIGRAVARLAAAFGMRVLALNRDGRRSSTVDVRWSIPGAGDPEASLPERIFSPDGLPDLLAQSDIVVLAAPLIPATRHLIDEAALRRMKPNALLINVARGGLVDEAALVRALEEDWIAGAALDVFEEEPLPAGSPLWRLAEATDRLLISPHVSSFTPAYDDRVTDLFAENLRRYLAGRPLLNRVRRERGY